MDQQLLPPYAATTMDLKAPTGKLPLRYPPLSSKSTAPLHAGGHKDERSSGGLCRTIVLCVLALAVCAGFVLLYLQMRDLERQVQELRELTFEAGSYGPYDDEESEPGRTSHSQRQDKMEHGLPVEDDMLSDENDVDWLDQRGHTRKRRSSGGRTSLAVGRANHHRMNHEREGQPSAHVVPLTTSSAQPTDNYYPISAWFQWTDQTPGISHASIPLHEGRYLVAPHSGYYFIYSQVTLLSCNNRTDSTARGHSLYVKTNCGQETEKLLTYTVTTPLIRNGGCTQDSGYIGGVFYLDRNDYVGVKPKVPIGRLHSRIDLTQGNSYFGMILVSKFTQISPGRRPCSPSWLY